MKHVRPKRKGTQVHFITAREYDRLTGVGDSVTLDADDWNGREGDTIYLAVMGDRRRVAVARVVKSAFPTPRTRSVFLDLEPSHNTVARA